MLAGVDWCVEGSQGTQQLQSPFRTRIQYKVKFTPVPAGTPAAFVAGVGFL